MVRRRRGCGRASRLGLGAGCRTRGWRHGARGRRRAWCRRDRGAHQCARRRHRSGRTRPRRVDPMQLRVKRLPRGGDMRQRPALHAAQGRREDNRETVGLGCRCAPADRTWGADQNCQSHCHRHDPGRGRGVRSVRGGRSCRAREQRSDSRQAGVAPGRARDRWLGRRRRRRRRQCILNRGGILSPEVRGAPCRPRDVVVVGRGGGPPGRRPERDQLLARAQPVTRQADDVAVGLRLGRRFVAVRVFRFQRFAELLCRTTKDVSARRSSIPT